MKALHADPKTVRELFTKEYIIPDFQRPYSWEKEQCDKLWDDVIDFIENNNSVEKYFLGNIIVHPYENKLAVIDGQQRLTTLMLFIKALHNTAGTVGALEECLKIKDPLTSKFIDKLKIESEVIADDKNALNDIIFNSGENLKDENLLKKNFKFFYEKINLWWKQSNNSTENLNKLILRFLDNIVILPIECGSQDDALIIFETINNRGMALSDSDIFKAKLHSFSMKDNKKDEFTKRWNSLKEHEWLFRIHMHILRAEKKDIGREIGLRNYFDDKQILSNWKKVLYSLEIYHAIDNTWECSDEISIWWLILDTYPNIYWTYPLYVFLHKYGKFENEEFTLEKEIESEFINLLRNLTKYLFIKGLLHNSVNSIKDTIFKICKAIDSEEDYSIHISQNLSEEELHEFTKKIEKNHGRYLRGLVLLSAYLNENQNKSDFFNVISNNYHVEHILPKSWNHYDSWTEETYEENINKLGNLVPLEWKINIKAQNEFFSRKQIKYQDSKIQDVQELLPLKSWYFEDFLNRNTEIINRLRNFFKYENRV
ncbi:MAG: DUF262 domain-containing HNH endonuclease family protein [Aliarcobacter butzleri]|uniref:DUF262 domain-containing protein n=1 Tax=Aliarcobacter butzleri TaxID=28197 RepID=UPI0015878B3A|nr:DUF262 domain-containing protein [Aliarcobacter butzleri]MDY0193380.1 DUF262 domain-containing HNH endonuclease family protein [Aliarcobacter butzleri]NUW27246.1 DUF262 domain-containing protein [Aliarcobacter butzleri]